MSAPAGDVALNFCIGPADFERPKSILCPSQTVLNYVIPDNIRWKQNRSGIYKKILNFLATGTMILFTVTVKNGTKVIYSKVVGDLELCCA